MIKTLRESKAKLSELVELANQGEDVLITVRGQVRARLVKAGPEEGAMEGWVQRLDELQKQYSTGRHRLSTEEILRQDREERDRPIGTHRPFSSSMWRNPIPSTFYNSPVEVQVRCGRATSLERRS